MHSSGKHCRGSRHYQRAVQRSPLILRASLIACSCGICPRPRERPRVLDKSGLTQTTGSGTFTFTPTSGGGWYYFGLVAVNNAGLQSAPVTGSGNGCTIYDLLWSDSFASDNFTTGGWTTSHSADCTISTTQVYTGDTYSARLAATNTGSYTYIQKALRTVGRYTNIIVSYARYLNDSTTGSFVCEYSINGGTSFVKSGNCYTAA